MGQLTVRELEPGTVFVQDKRVYMVANPEQDGRVEVMILGAVLDRDMLQFTTLDADAAVDVAVQREPA